MTTWRMRASASARSGFFDYIGHPHLDLISPRGSVTDVEVTEVPVRSGDGSYFGWIPAGEDAPVMIRCGSDPYRAQFTYGPEAEERRGKGRTVRLRVTEAAGGERAAAAGDASCCPACGASGSGGHGGGCPNAGIRYAGPDRGGRGMDGGSRP